MTGGACRARMAMVAVVGYLACFLVAGLVVAESPLVSAEVVSEQGKVLQAALDELEKCKLQYREAKTRLGEEAIKLRWRAEQDAHAKEQLRNRGVSDLIGDRLSNLYAKGRDLVEYARRPEAYNEAVKYSKTKLNEVRNKALRISIGLLIVATEGLQSVEKDLLHYLRESLPSDMVEHAETLASSIVVGIPALLLAYSWHALLNKILGWGSRLIFGEKSKTKHKPPRVDLDSTMDDEVPFAGTREAGEENDLYDDNDEGNVDDIGDENSDRDDDDSQVSDDLARTESIKEKASPGSDLTL